MTIPAEITSLLQDEAYAVLCQESLNEALAGISREKEVVLSTRPPFGMLASSERREVFQKSLRAVEDNEAGLRGRLDQLTQIDKWLKGAIEKALSDFLPSVSPEFGTCHQAAEVVIRWEQSVSGLHDQSLALAREAHALSASVNPIPLPNGKVPSSAAIDHARGRALANLRTSVMVIQATAAEIFEIRKEFTQLCDAQADGLQLPEPPDFRNLAWIDKLASLSTGAVTSEAVRCEDEARDFHKKGLKSLLGQAVEVREACVEASKTILAQYWRRLREHAQTHFVQEREIDEVIAELSQHRMAAEAGRHKATFEAVNLTFLR